MKNKTVHIVTYRELYCLLIDTQFPIMNYYTLRGLLNQIDENEMET